MFWMLNFELTLMQIGFIEHLVSIIWRGLLRVLLLLPHMILNAVEMIRLVW